MPARLLKRKRFYKALLITAVLISVFLIFQIFSMYQISPLHDSNSNRHHPLRDHRTHLPLTEHEENFNLARSRGRFGFGMHGDADQHMQQQPHLVECNDTKCIEPGRHSHERLPHLIGKQTSTLQPKDGHLHADAGPMQKPAHEQAAKLYDFLADHIIVYNIENQGDAPEPIHGVLPQLMHRYIPGDDNLFECHTSKEVIDMNMVNDDYCDCEDGSDEPGTSACDYRFYCTFQIAGNEAIYMPSSRVSDGICDCCDGSDELHMIHDHHRGGMPTSHNICQDTCDAVIQRDKQIHETQNKGKEIREGYVQQAKDIMNPKPGEYGTDNAYYPLSKMCYDTHADKYTYTVCPFRSAHQKDHSMKKDIGHKPRWISKHVLVMEGGDRMGCPGNEGRKTKIEFHCGIENRIESLLEQDRCVYQVFMTSPAAC